MRMYQTVRKYWQDENVKRNRMALVFFFLIVINFVHKCYVQSVDVILSPSLR